jgi:YVTN family beta-propeller protein
MKLRKNSFLLPVLAGFLSIAPTCISVNAQSFAYVPDGTNVSVIDTGTNTVVATLSGLGSPFGVAVTPNGSFAYVTNFQGTTVSVIDRTNTVVATVPGLAQPFTIAVTPSGAFAYTGNLGNDTVSVINTATNGVVATIPLPHGSAPVGVAILPNSSFVYVSDQGTNTVSVINTATNAVVASVPVGASPAFLASTPNGVFVYVPNFGSTTVSIISTATNSVVATVPVGTHPDAVAVRPDGAIAYVSNKDDNTISAISTATNSVLSVTPVGNGPSEIAFSADGSFAYIVNLNGGTVSVLETASNTIVATIPIVSGVQTIAVSPADNDSSFSQLNGSNSFNGNQTINGDVTATSFSGRGSGLTGVNAATAMMASGLNCAGCVGNTQLAINYAAGDTQGGNALNALMFGGLLPSAFAPASGSPNYAPLSGSTSYVAKSGDTMSGMLNLPANGLVAGGNQLVLSGGNVGIGTASPGGLSGYTSLHIDQSATGFGGAFLELSHSATGTDAKVVSDDNGFLLEASNATPVKIKAGNFNGGSDPGHIYIGVNGNVGLGTNNPAATLEVNGTARFDNTVTFASGQTFPGAGAITGVTAGTGLAGGGSIGTVTLNNTGVLSIAAGSGLNSSGGQTPTLSLNTSFTDGRYAQLGTANTFTANQMMPNLTVSGHSTFGSLSAFGQAIIVGGVTSEAGSGNPAVYGQSGPNSGPAGYFNVCRGCPGNLPGGLFAGPDIIEGANGGVIQFRVDYAGNIATSGNFNASGSLTIGGGTAIAEYVSTADSITVPALTPGTCSAFTTPAVTGFTPGTSDTIALGIPSELVSNLGSGIFLMYQAWETTSATSPTITIQACNPTAVKYKGGASGTLRIDIFKH